MRGNDRGYVSVLEWPDGLSEGDRVDLVSAATGLDMYNARLRAQRPAPLVLACLPVREARAAGEALRELGALVFVPMASEMAGCAEAQRAKCLEAAQGAPEPTYLCHLWRGDPIVLRSGELYLIVRARLKRSERTEGRMELNYEPMTGAMSFDVGAAGSRMAVSDLMDLWFRDGARVRINGDKFNFDVLGAERGYSDNENADRLALRLAGEGPRAMVDTSFGAFHCPGDVLRGAMNAGFGGSFGGRRRSDAPAFDFYSVWRYLMHGTLAV